MLKHAPKQTNARFSYPKLNFQLPRAIALKKVQQKNTIFTGCQVLLAKVQNHDMSLFIEPILNNHPVNASPPGGNSQLHIQRPPTPLLASLLFSLILVIHASTL